MKRKLVTVQPFSIYGLGGGSRILRRLFASKEDHIVSIGISENSTANSGRIKEILVESFPGRKKWMRSYLRMLFTFLMRNYFFRINVKKLHTALNDIDADILHIVDHGYNTLSVLPSMKNKFEIWVSFHDHFFTSGSNESSTRLLWEMSDRRLVISKEMGVEYQNLFGYKDVEIITDGVDRSELSQVKEIKDDIIVYFAGLLHIDYLPLFKILADVLDEYAEHRNFKLLLRGTQEVSFLNGRKFEVQYLPPILDSILLKKELDQADILYLPIKFTVPEFYKFSLSTKMVGYLGGSGVILYHGPGNSAACNLLKENDAAIICTSLNKKELQGAIDLLLKDGKARSQNAKKLAIDKFLLEDIQNKFWRAN